MQAFGTREMTRKGRSHDEPNLWLAFSGGVILAAIIWLALHKEGQGAGWKEGIAEQANRSTIKQEHSDSDETQPSKNMTYMVGVQSGEKVDKKLQSNLDSDKTNHQEEYNQPIVRVYITETKSIEKVALEDYVRGVVTAEMPLDFGKAALEAQAMAARTYIIRRLWLDDRTGVYVKVADVTDTQAHQVYRSLKQVKQLQENDEVSWRKVDDAVRETSGDIIIFGDQPIEALYFSTSNGYTENSEEVFSSVLPYLRSVASPWDKEASPRAQEKVEMRLDDFYDRLGVKAVPAARNISIELAPRIIEWTKGRRVKELVVGNKRLSGEEVRHLLGLRSSSFDWVISKNRITLTTYGSGHGVGMSQWGAEGMARAGKTAEQIVQHYYSGTRIEKVSKLVNSTGKRL
ncbi:stage II sporulation protein D [Cohnella sp.]|uniref:stage II sporulation protein D n=1 Tax=Cohnella sp. TaxID=1883426 RepID=UPI0035647288